MAHYPDLSILTDLLGIPYEDALRAMEQTGGDAHAAADLALSKQERRRSATNTRAGPSNSILTPPTTSSPETFVIEDEDDDDENHDSDNSDEEEEEDDQSSQPAPIPTPDSSSYVINSQLSDEEDEEFEQGDDDDYSPLLSPLSPAPLHRTTTSGSRDKGKAAAIVQTAPELTHGSPHAGGYTSDDEHTAPTLTHSSLHADAYTSDDEHAPPHCVCQEPNNINMIQCTTCNRWFHYECAHLTPSTIPEGPWYCHFEANSSSPALDRRGLKFNEFESRALYLSVKHCAPLGRDFWPTVSRYLAAQFNVTRTHTSTKLEWLRNSSAVWGFDERDCTQYGAEQMEKRKGLFRSQLEGRVIPPRIHFRAIGAGIDPAETTTEVDIKERVGLNARKPVEAQQQAATVHQQAATVPQQPRAPKRRRVILEDSEVEDDTVVLAPAPKRARTAAPRRPTGGKFVNGFDVNGTRAPAQILRPVARPGHVVHTNGSVFGNAGPRSSSSVHRAQPTSQAPLLTDTFVLNDNDHRHLDVTNLAEDPSINPPVQDLFSNTLALINPTDGPVEYWYCNYGPPPQFESRFDALAEHRRHVKEMLKDIEPNLDWSEGPWHGANELLWTGDEVNQMRYMFEGADEE